MLSVQGRSQDWAAQAGLWVLAGSRRERLEVLHTGLAEVLEVALRNALAEEEAGHSLAEL